MHNKGALAATKIQVPLKFHQLYMCLYTHTQIDFLLDFSSSSDFKLSTLTLLLI